MKFHTAAKSFKCDHPGCNNAYKSVKVDLEDHEAVHLNSEALPMYGEVLRQDLYHEAVADVAHRKACAQRPELHCLRAPLPQEGEAAAALGHCAWGP